MRRKPEPSAALPGQLDIFDRLLVPALGEDAVRQDKIRRAQEKEQTLGHNRPSAKQKRAWSLNRQRVAEVRNLVLRRHDGPCDTADAETYLEAALPHFAKLYPDPNQLRTAVDAWACTLLPTIPRARVLAMIEECEAREWRTADADKIAGQLCVTNAERKALGLLTIGAIDRNKAKRAEDRKAENAAHQRRKRELNGATPRAKSKAATKPWEAEGVSRSTYFARQKRDGVAFTPAVAEPDRTVSSAVVRRTHLLVTDQSDARKQTLQVPARQASESRNVGAGGHSPRSIPKAVRTGHAVPLPLPTDGVSQPDLLAEFQPLAVVVNTYLGGVMPPELALAVRAAQRARLVTQESVARSIGISRPQLANALQGRFGLSQSAAANLLRWLEAA